MIEHAFTVLVNGAAIYADGVQQFTGLTDMSVWEFVSHHADRSAVFKQQLQTTSAGPRFQSSARRVC